MLEDSTQPLTQKHFLTRKQKAAFRMFHPCNKCIQGRHQHATQSHADRSFEFPVTVRPPVRVLALLHLTSMQQDAEECAQSESQSYSTDAAVDALFFFVFYVGTDVFNHLYITWNTLSQFFR